MIAVHAAFYTKWRRVVKREFTKHGMRKYTTNENTGLAQRGVIHIFIGVGENWKAPCGATTKRIVGIGESFEYKIKFLKGGYRPCKKCKAWLEKNEASLRMAEAVS